MVGRPPKAHADITPQQLAALAEEVWGGRWQRPFANLIGRSPRTIRQWMDGSRAIQADAVDTLRALRQLDGAGEIIRNAVLDEIPKTSPLTALQIGKKAYARLCEAGLLKEQRDDATE
jgi:hypothetical protein